MKCMTQRIFCPTFQAFHALLSTLLNQFDVTQKKKTSVFNIIYDYTTLLCRKNDQSFISALPHPQ